MEPGPPPVLSSLVLREELKLNQTRIKWGKFLREGAPQEESKKTTEERRGDKKEPLVC